MRRRALVMAGLLAILAIGTLGALRATVRLLRTEILGALGPGAKIGALEVGMRQLSLDDLMLPGTKRWPAPASLRAERVAIVPSLLSLFSRQIRITSVDVETPYVSMLRTRRGQLRIVPTLLERPPSPRGTDEHPRLEPSAPRTRTAPEEPGPPPPTPRSVSVGRITISHGEVDLYDASVARPPWRIRLMGVDASIVSVIAPVPRGRSSLDVQAIIDGPSRDGAVSVAGWVEPETKDLELTARLRGVDLLTFRPYVARSATARLSGGVFDLDLRATVREGRLTAPGHLVLSDVAFSPGSSGSDRVMGVPRDLLLAALSEQHGRIAFDFTLTGDVNDPHFSLNEAVATGVVAALVDSLAGVSVPGLVKGVGQLGGGTFKGADQVGKTLGEAIKGLWRRP